MKYKLKEKKRKEGKRERERKTEGKEEEIQKKMEGETKVRKKEGRTNKRNFAAPRKGSIIQSMSSITCLIPAREVWRRWMLLNVALTGGDLKGNTDFDSLRFPAYIEPKQVGHGVRDERPIRALDSPGELKILNEFTEVKLDWRTQTKVFFLLIYLSSRPV